MAKSKVNGKSRGKRRSKAEDMTGAKDAKVEVRKGELGLGEPVVIESKDFAFHMRAIKSATERKDTANSLLSHCMKAAKKVNKHLPSAIKECIALEKADDPLTLKQKLEVLGIALKEVGSSVQLTVHDTLLGDVTDQAKKRGFEAGSGGKSLVNPYPAQSDLAHAYTVGWNEGMGHNVGLTPEETMAALAKHDEEAVGQA